MVPSPKPSLLAALIALLACDADTHAVATVQPTPFLAADMAAMADKPTPAERKAKRAAKQAKAEQTATPKETAKPKKNAKSETTKPPDPEKTTTSHPRPAKQSTTAPTTTASSTSPPTSTLPTCPPDNALTYRSFGDGFLRTWCTGCHSSTLAASDRQDAPMGIDFDRALLYKPHARDVYDRAVLEAHAAVTNPNAASPMPPAGIVPEDDRRRLGQWIACGSPGA